MNDALIAMPVVLDVDGAVGPLDGELRLPLAEWQEGVRFGCSWSRLRGLGQALDARLPSRHGTVLMGSGDFHHLSALLVERCAAQGAEPMRVVVFDNHPDNMRFPFGVHCGSWVRHVAGLPNVSGVDVVGITSGDIGAAHAWENRLAPLRAGRLRYWSVGVDTGWSRWLGLRDAFRSFADIDSLVDALVASLRASAGPVYVSIDKDVFSTEVVQTNWDQGRMHEAQLMRALDAVQGRVVGSDITGDVSSYRYTSGWKRWLSRLDAQDTAIEPATLAAWQAAQHALNGRLVARLAAASSTPAPSPR